MFFTKNLKESYLFLLLLITASYSITSHIHGVKKNNNLSTEYINFYSSSRKPLKDLTALIENLNMDNILSMFFYMTDIRNHKNNDSFFIYLVKNKKFDLIKKIIKSIYPLGNIYLEKLINQMNGRNQTALNFAKKYPIIIKLFKKHGGKIGPGKIRQIDLNLLTAIKNLDLEKTKDLVTNNNNINVNFQDTFDGKTPLHWAAIKNNLKAIKLLIKSEGLYPGLKARGFQPKTN